MPTTLFQRIKLQQSFVCFFPMLGASWPELSTDTDYPAVFQEGYIFSAIALMYRHSNMNVCINTYYTTDFTHYPAPHDNKICSVRDHISRISLHEHQDLAFKNHRQNPLMHLFEDFFSLLMSGWEYIRVESQETQISNRSNLEITLSGECSLAMAKAM